MRSPRFSNRSRFSLAFPRSLLVRASLVVWIVLIALAGACGEEAREPGDELEDFDGSLSEGMAADTCSGDGSCAPPDLSINDAGKRPPDGPSVVSPCQTDADCTVTGKPFCTSTGCVQCRSSADCSPGTLVCQAGACAATSTCGQGPKPTLGQTAWPVPAVKKTCQAFGNKIAYQSCGFHTGIDVCGATGTALVSIAAGKVVHVGYMWFNGAKTGRGPYAVIIQHAPSFYSTYGHNNKAWVKVGDCVTAGQKIADMGSLGYSSGPHLHFEILDGTPFTNSWQVPFQNACSYYKNPMLYLKP